MSEKRDPETALTISLDAYPAWVGPSEMWWQVLDALGPAEDFEARVESLSSSMQSRLRETFQAMPPVCYFDYLSQAEPGDEHALLCTRFIAWCERTAEADSSPASPS